MESEDNIMSVLRIGLFALRNLAETHQFHAGKRVLFISCSCLLVVPALSSLVGISGPAAVATALSATSLHKVNSGM
jgi:hypothetical protein